MVEYIDLIGRWLIIVVGVLGCIAGVVYLSDRVVSYVASAYNAFETIGEYAVYRKEFKT